MRSLTPRRASVATVRRSTSSPGIAAGAVLAGLATSLAPLVYLTALKEPFRLPKLALSESFALLSLALLSGRLVEVVSERRPAALWSMRLAVVAAVPMAAIASLGLVTSSHPAHVREALPSFLLALAAVVGWSLAFSPAVLRRLLDFTLVPAVLLALVAVLQFHDVWQPFAIDPSEEDPRVRITSLAGNVGDLSAYLVLPLLIAQARFWEAWPNRRSQRLRLVSWGAAGALCLYVLLVTSTLTALLAFAVSTLVSWLVLIERKRRFVLVLAVAVVVGALSIAAGPLRARALEKLDAVRRGDMNDLLTGRLDGWRGGLYLARERPLLGVGHGAFRAEFAPAKLALIERGVTFFEDQRTAIFANAHNEPIEVAAEWGLPGVIALAAAVASLAVAARRLILAGGSGSQASWRADGALAAAGLASLGALALAFFPFRIALTGYQAVLFFAWLIGSAAARDGASEPARPAVASRAATAGAAASLTRRRDLATATAVAILLIAALHARRALDRVSASRELQRIESTTALMLDADRAVPMVIQANRRALEDLRRRDPSEPAVLTTLAAQYVLMERWREALEWYERGLELEPRPELWFGRGMMELRLGDRDAAVESFATAVKLSPPLEDELPGGLR